MDSSYVYFSDVVDNDEKELIRTLSEKRILVDLETNELDMLTYIYNNQVLKNNILELTLIITRQCNYRCVYCYEDHLDLPMTDEVYGRILSFIEKSHINGQYSGVSISLFGGEPLLEYERLFLFLQSANNFSKKYGKLFSAGMTTNGSLLFPERFLQLNTIECKHFQITVDGLRDTHDSYRIATDGKRLKC